MEQILQGYKPAQMMKPYIQQYPTGNKVGIVCCLDGDIEDKTSNKFKFSKDSKTITRSRRVPKECLDAEILLNGMNKDNVEGMAAGFGSSDLDVLVLNSALKSRLKENSFIRDDNGNIWEPRDVINLPTSSFSSVSPSSTDSSSLSLTSEATSSSLISMSSSSPSSHSKTRLSSSSSSSHSKTSFFSAPE